MSAVTSAAVVLSLTVALAFLAWSTLTDRRAMGWAIVAAAGLSLGAAQLFPLRVAGAAVLVIASLALRSRPQPWARAAAGILAPLAAFASPGLGIAAVTASSWRALSRWQPVVEATVLTGVLLAARLASPEVAILLPATSAAIGWIIAHRLGPIGGIPSRRATIVILRAGAPLGLLALLAVDSWKHIVPIEGIARGSLLMIPAIGGGVLALLVPLGAGSLLAVRDEARIAMLLCVAGGIFAGLIDGSALVLAFLPAVVLALGAGCARVQALRPLASLKTPGETT